MDTRTTTSSSAISEMISLIRIWMRNIICSRKFLVEITIGNEFFWIRETFFIIVDCPPIEHDYRVLGDEIALVPIVFCYSVIHAEFVDRSPSQKFCVLVFVKRSVYLWWMLWDREDSFRLPRQERDLSQQHDLILLGFSWECVGIWDTQSRSCWARKKSSSQIPIHLRKVQFLSQPRGHQRQCRQSLA